MQITGTIRNILPAARGGYQSQNGYIFTYDMTIQATDGQTCTGEIGSKKDMYPLGIGQQITVDIVNSEHGARFKKVNPQYQQSHPPQQQSYTPPPQAPSPQQQQAFNREMEQPSQPDWDEIARGKVRCNIVCAAIQGGQMKCESPADAQSYMDYIFTGNTGGGKNPDYNENPPPTPPGEDVPF